MLPIIRTFISFPAGVARMPFWRFTLFTVLGCIPWMAGLTFAGKQAARQLGGPALLPALDRLRGARRDRGRRRLAVPPLAQGPVGARRCPRRLTPRGALPARHALALGLLHGPAELLPVSSSGHITLVPWLLGWPYPELDPELRKAFEVALHAGTAVGLLIALRGEVAEALRDLDGRRVDAARRLVRPAGRRRASTLERPIERRLGTPGIDRRRPARRLGRDDARRRARAPSGARARTRRSPTRCCSASRRRRR